MPNFYSSDNNERLNGTTTAEQESAWRRQDAGHARLMGDPRIESGAASCAFNQPINILRLPDVIKRVGLKRAAIYLHIAQGTFPKQISLGARAVGWIESEIDVWLAERVSASRTEPKI